MDSLTTHPKTAAEAKNFVAPSSLSYPGGAGDLTPPSDKDGSSQPNGASQATGLVNGQKGQGLNANGTVNGVTPSTPAATPGAAATTGASGIVPTLQ